MDELRKIIAVLIFSVIMLAFPATAFAQTPAGMNGSITFVDQSDKGMLAAMMDTKDISIAAATMKKAGIEDMINPGENYTLFVASDTALNSMSPDMKEIMAESMNDRQVAIEFVEGHMISDMITPDEMADGKTLEFMNGKTITVKRADGRIMVEDASVIKAVKTGNGIVYVMDRIPSSIKTMMEQTGILPASTMS